MTTVATPEDTIDLRHLPSLPKGRDLGIGVIGAGFITRDCHLVAYAQAGFPVVGITSRTRSTAEEVARLRGVPHVFDSVEELLDHPDVVVVDVAVPPLDQPGVIERILRHRRPPRGILAQKPLAMTPREALAIVNDCATRGITLQVNQNMRYDHAVRAGKTLIDSGALGEMVLATIDMRAIPHWMPWAEGGRSLSTYIMSIHHLDTMRYWLGDPEYVLASTRPDPRTRFPHSDGINLVILEFPRGARGSNWDDVWAGPAKEGGAPAIGIQWRLEGTRGAALGTVGWPGWPDRVPSTIDYNTLDQPGVWHRPRWPEAWFPDAFVGTMAGLLIALETGENPDIWGRDNLRTIGLCEAVLTAAREHQVIHFPSFLAKLGLE